MRVNTNDLTEVELRAAAEMPVKVRRRTFCATPDEPKVEPTAQPRSLPDMTSGMGDA